MWVNCMNKYLFFSKSGKKRHIKIVKFEVKHSKLKICFHILELIKTKSLVLNGWEDGWVDGGKASLRIAYSNLKMSDSGI